MLSIEYLGIAMGIEPLSQPTDDHDQMLQLPVICHPT